MNRLLTLEHRELILKYRNLMLEIQRQLLDCGDVYVSDVHKLSCYKLDSVFGFAAPFAPDGSRAYWADAILDPTFDDSLIKPGDTPTTQDIDNES